MAEKFVPAIDKHCPFGWLLYTVEARLEGWGPTSETKQVAVLKIFDGEGFVDYDSREGVEVCNKLLIEEQLWRRRLA